MQGWVFDVYPDHDRDVMVTWVLTEEGPIRIEDGFTPCIYVGAPAPALNGLVGKLGGSDAIIRMRIVDRLVDIRETRPRPVLEIALGRYDAISEVARGIDAMGGYRDYALYDVDQGLQFRYLCQKGLFPNARVEVHDRRFELLDDIHSLDYAIPPFKVLRLDAPYIDPYSVEKPIRSLDVDGEGIVGDDEHIIRELASIISMKDPDIIVTGDGDEVLMPCLKFKAASMHIDLAFGRDARIRDPFRKRERSYFSYGRILYKPAPFILKGRAHLDRSSFMMEEGDIEGLVDLSRLSGICMQQMSRLSPGTAISSMQMRQASADGYLIPWKKNQPERFKSARQLLISDRGGFIFEPRVGIFEKVTEVDFTSMYPTIMVKYNISPETLLCDCCGPSNVVPGLGYHICTKRRGLIPRILEPVVARRTRYKKLAKEDGPRADVYKKRAVLLKWLLVTCFGYTGYRNARFGKIECHESINAYGRETLLDAMEVAQEHGFTILHGIVDSLWLKGDPDKGPETAKAIATRCGIPMEIEGVYKWVVFLQSKGNGIGALNRYYGVFEDGRIKVRGIEARRSDTPAFIVRFQDDALKALAKADDAQGFMRQIPECLELARTAARRLARGDVDPKELVLTKTVSMSLSEYRTTNDQASCLAVLRKRGIHVAPGQDVRFVITDASSRDPEARVVPEVFLDDGTRYDARAYTVHIARALESLLTPFGWTEERVLRQICVPNWIPGNPHKGGMGLNLRPGPLSSL